ncbi:Cytochrome P450 82C4 [Hibiscus syriacus]|uniref:Cytochrome P450 82C4 n=1 Tax=Hibiscus syriacus TaxID=106335 RepID=A0A6A2W9I1_HIBSY|nr:Cytochrome P450 82C4 [Hibiscus syriacus]
MEISLQFQVNLLFALFSTIIITISVAIILVTGKKKQQRMPPEPASTRLGIHRALVVSNWEVAKECFTTNDKVFLTRSKSLAVKHMGYDRNMLGFAPYGLYWRSARRLVTVELLSSRRLELLKHVPDIEIDSFIKDLYEQSVRNRGVAVVDDCWKKILCDGKHRKNKADSKGVGFCTRKLGERASRNEADDTIKATCLIIVLGGIETNVVTLTWAVSLLLNNLHVLKKAQDELDINETMRLYPAAPLSVPREAIEDCTVAGFHVQAGTRLLVNLWKLQRDPGIWSKPLEFLPERFLSDHANIDVRGQNFELIPFGCGRRICPGITFMLRFQHLALARLLHGLKWGTVSDNAVNMSESPGISVPKATPLEVTLTPKLPSMLYR